MTLLAAMKLKNGILIVFEGIDGSGKSTQARLLLKRLKGAGFEAVFFREPTMGPWGREIKRLAALAGSLTPEEELDLFLKDRRENVRLNLKPALEAGKVVVLDRYYFSTLAYQGAKGIDRRRIRGLHRAFVIIPDLVIILDIAADQGLARIAERKTRDELFEREDYLAKVRKIFRSFRGRNIMHLDGRGDKRAIAAAIWARVQKLLTVSQ
jgi:dTMP kinase